MTDRLIRLTTALAVLMVASVAAVICYQHAYELVRSHHESGITAHLLLFTIDGLFWAATMMVLDASRRNPVPLSPSRAWPLASWPRSVSPDLEPSRPGEATTTLPMTQPS